MLYPVDLKESSKIIQKYSRNKFSSPINVDSRLCKYQRMTSGHPAHKPAEVSNCEGEKEGRFHKLCISRALRVDLNSL